MSTQSFLIKAIANNYRPRVINIDKSGSNNAAIKVYNKRSFSKIKIRQCKYLNFHKNSYIAEVVDSCETKVDLQETVIIVFVFFVVLYYKLLGVLTVNP